MRPVIEQKIRDMIGGVDRDRHPDPNGRRFLFVAAAGNLGPLMSGARGQCDANGGVMEYPATLGTSIKGLISVGGTTRQNAFWSGSCAGPLVEVAAPADDLVVASITGTDHYRGTKPDLRSGTSYAAPYVAGIAARLLESDPSLTPVELEKRIESLPSRLADGSLPVPHCRSRRVDAQPRIDSLTRHRPTRHRRTKFSDELRQLRRLNHAEVIAIDRTTSSGHDVRWRKASRSRGSRTSAAKNVTIPGSDRKERLRAVRKL